MEVCVHCSYLRLNLMVCRPHRCFNSQINHQLNCVHSLRWKLYKTGYHLSYYYPVKLWIQTAGNDVWDWTHFPTFPKALSHFSLSIQDYPQYQKYLIDKYVTSVQKVNLLNGTFILLINSRFHRDLMFDFQSNAPCALSQQLCDFSIKEEVVFKILSLLDQTKATGINSIGPRLLRICALYAYYLYFSQLIVFKCYPCGMETHVITPVY